MSEKFEESRMAGENENKEQHWIEVPCNRGDAMYDPDQKRLHIIGHSTEHEKRYGRSMTTVCSCGAERCTGFRHSESTVDFPSLEKAKEWAMAEEE